jgi:hypothetical protein
VQDNPIKPRIEWFKDVKACRRRRQQSWDTTRVMRLFTTQDEYFVVEQNAVIIRVGHLIHSTGLGLVDVFRAWNPYQTGRLCCSELYGGLDWLGMQVTPAQLHAIFRVVDLNGDGYISYQEFFNTFGKHSGGLGRSNPQQAKKQLPRATVQQLAQNTDIVIQPKIIAELHNDAQDEVPQLVPMEELREFYARIKSHEKFDAVWDSEGSSSRDVVKIWAPVVSVDRNSARLCVGHYAAPNSDSLTSRSNSDTPHALMEVDRAGVGIFASKFLVPVLEQFFPHPRRFRLVWNHVQAKRPVYAWRAIPPSANFVSLGMLLTCSEDEPSPELYRCVPKQWVVESRVRPRKIWDDSGLGGRPGSMWVVNSAGVVVVTQGHSQPKGPFYDLCQREFALEKHHVLSASMSQAPVPASETNFSGVAGWLDWKEGSPGGNWSQWFRFYAVLNPQHGALELYEDESEAYVGRGRQRTPSSTLVLHGHRLDTSRAVEARHHRPHALELFVGQAHQQLGPDGSAVPVRNLPPKRLYSAQAGYAGSIVLQPTSAQERTMWSKALVAMINPREPSTAGV